MRGPPEGKRPMRSWRQDHMCHVNSSTCNGRHGDVGAARAHVRQSSIHALCLFLCRSCAATLAHSRRRSRFVELGVLALHCGRSRQNKASKCAPPGRKMSSNSDMGTEDCHLRVSSTSSALQVRNASGLSAWFMVGPYALMGAAEVLVQLGCSFRAVCEYFNMFLHDVVSATEH